MEREIVLDTETTGLDPLAGHRIIEIGCVELINRMPTGRVFHKYLNPEREVPIEATNIHGITTEFLKDKQKFNEIVDEFVEFIGNSKIIIHNAEFDLKFLNHHLFNAKKPDISRERVFCTLIYARKKFPGASNSLDGLCKRFQIDNSHRTHHGALLDSEILAEVYLELMGGKQNDFDLQTKKKVEQVVVKQEIKTVNFEYRKFDISAEERDAHKKLVSGGNYLWNKVN